MLNHAGTHNVFLRQARVHGHFDILGVRMRLDVNCCEVEPNEKRFAPGILPNYLLRPLGQALQSFRDYPAGFPGAKWRKWMAHQFYWPINCAQPTYLYAWYLNFCPPTLASYISPPLAMVRIMMPFSYLAFAAAPAVTATALA